jgi:hypothetical protein
MKVTIYFSADPSVGIFPYSYEMEIPTFDNEYREEIRKQIKDLYTELDGEFITKIIFSDEQF